MAQTAGTERPVGPDACRDELPRSFRETGRRTTARRQRRERERGRTRDRPQAGRRPAGGQRDRRRQGPPRPREEVLRTRGGPGTGAPRVRDAGRPAPARRPRRGGARVGDDADGRGGDRHRQDDRLPRAGRAGGQGRGGVDGHEGAAGPDHRQGHPGHRGRDRATGPGGSSEGTRELPVQAPAQGVRRELQGRRRRVAPRSVGRPARPRQHRRDPGLGGADQDRRPRGARADARAVRVLAGDLGDDRELRRAELRPLRGVLGGEGPPGPRRRRRSPS